MPHDLGVVHEILTREFGELSDFHEFRTWGPTLVVGADDAAGNRVVLKASSLQDVRIEAETSRLARAAGVPVPAILAEGADDRLPGSSWFVMQRLRGIPWNEASWSSSQHLALINELAGHLASLHRVRISGYGPLTLEGVGPFESWSSWLGSGFDRATNALQTASLLDDHFCSELSIALLERRSELDARPSSLVHGDLGDGEIYADEETYAITGIVDWGASVVGDPYYEFARFVAGGPVDDPRPAAYRVPLRRAYEEFSGTAVPPRLAVETLYSLHNTLLNAEWSLIEAPDWVDPLCHEANRLLSSID